MGVLQLFLLAGSVFMEARPALSAYEGIVLGSPEERMRALEEMRSRLDEIRKMAYDENAYRGPMGLGILLAMIFLFIYGLIYFMAS